jgi:hypothetical protein
VKLYIIRSANLGAEVKITTNWYEEATSAEVDSAAGVVELRQQLATVTEQRDALLAAATKALSLRWDLAGGKRWAISLLEAAIALCAPKQVTP